MATGADRQMTMVAFLQAQNCSNYPASWRHAATAQDFLTADYYQRIARTLEAGKFHLAFFDDRLAMPDRYGDDHAESVRHGIRVVKLDLIPLLTAMGLATRHLGVGGTYSTTYYEPFHVARVFSTLDHMVGGRAAWNVVTSLNDSEAANFGRASHPEHDARYDRADEFMEAVLGHWDTWEDDAIILDREGGVFADPAKVHRLDHDGAFFRTRGPFTVPATPQGHPVIIQAGQSGRGRRFAARWGELIFVISPTLELGRRIYREFRDEIAQTGRDPDRVRITPAAYVIAGETRAMAEDKAAYIDHLAHPLDSLVLLSEVLNFDFATLRHGRAVLGSEPRLHQRAAGPPRPRDPRERQGEPDGPRLHPAQRPRDPARDAGIRGQCGRGRRRARGVVHRRGLRRIRPRGDAHAGRLRGLRAARGAGAAAARVVSPRVRGGDAAREPRARAPRSRRVASLDPGRNVSE